MSLFHRHNGTSLNNTVLPRNMLAEAINFIIETEKLKAVHRQSSPVGVSRAENSAEHSWTASLAASVLIPAVAPDLDQLRVIKMLIIHDLVEIDAGDTFCYADQTGKQEREQRAAERIFSILATATQAEFLELWREFEDSKTRESRFANSIDRLLPLIQNYRNGGGGWKRHGIGYAQVYERNMRIQDGSPELWDYAQELIEAARSEGLLTDTPTVPEEAER